jgi:hypothetical protein
MGQYSQAITGLSLNLTCHISSIILFSILANMTAKYILNSFFFFLLLLCMWLEFKLLHLSACLIYYQSAHTPLYNTSSTKPWLKTINYCTLPTVSDLWNMFKKKEFRIYFAVIFANIENKIMEIYYKNRCRSIYYTIRCIDAFLVQVFQGPLKNVL